MFLHNAITAIFILTNINLAHGACGGSQLSGFQSGKVVTLEIDSMSEGPSFTKDDDGWIVMTSAASYCLQQIDQRATGFEKLPLACQAEVKRIVTKAAARSAAFKREQTSATYLAQLDATPEQKAEMVAALTVSDASLQKFAQLINQPGVSNGAFISEYKKFIATFDRHEYQVTKDPDAEFNPENQKNLLEIASLLRLKLPETRSAEEIRNSPRVSVTRCGGLVGGVSKEFLETLNSVEWKTTQTPNKSKSGSAR